MSEIRFYTILFIVCLASAVHAASPGVAKVYEYLPAPGQFINTLPAYSEGDDAAAMVAKAETSLKANSIICLGGFGGYVVVGFDHTIPNVADTVDFIVLGNAFEGSAEPGVIQVMRDENGNGLPDDTWYEIWGSAHDSTRTVFDYTIEYQAPDADDKIKWSDNKGGSGVITKNAFHSQSYYPLWVSNTSLTFTGTQLPPNGVNTGDDKSEYWVNAAFDYGYADNRPNNHVNASIDIDWATDDEGNHVDLEGIDFVRVYCGVNQICGWLGERSTEVSGVNDLHPIVGIDEVEGDIEVIRVGEYLYGVPENSDVIVYSLSGSVVSHRHGVSGQVYLPEYHVGLIIKIINSNRTIVIR